RAGLHRVAAPRPGPALQTAVREPGGRRHAEAHASGISGDPPGGALARVPVLHRGPAAQRHPGNQCSVAHSARVGFRAAAAAGTVAERRTGTPRGAATVTTLLHRLVAAAGT